MREQPQFWSKAQVLDWISYQVEKNKFDASTIDFSRCDMDGAALCSCGPEELRLAFGPLGDQLYAQLWSLSECGAGGGPHVPDEVWVHMTVGRPEGLGPWAAAVEPLGEGEGRGQLGSDLPPPQRPASRTSSAGSSTSWSRTVLRSRRRWGTPAPWVSAPR